MAGVITASMPLWVVENADARQPRLLDAQRGARQGAALRRLRAGRDRPLRWIRRVLGPALGEALREHGRRRPARAHRPGRSTWATSATTATAAASALLFKALAPALRSIAPASRACRGRSTSLAGNDHFFLNLSMAACKATMDAATASPAAAGHGDGAQRRRLRHPRQRPRRRWFTGAGARRDGLYFPGFGAGGRQPRHRRQRDHRDGRPRRLRHGGGAGDRHSSSAARRRTRCATRGDVRRSRWRESAAYAAGARLPRHAGGHRRAPGRQTGMLPVINTGIAHREPGVGQIGAGLVRPPMEPFLAGARALAEAA